MQDEIAILREELADIKRRLHGQVRLGKVTAVDVKEDRVTCISEGITQPDIPYLTFRAGEDKTYWLPSVGEVGLLVALSGEPANAFFMPGFFYTDMPAPENNENVALRVFRDGIEERIDTEAHSHTLKINTVKRVTNRSKVEDTVGSNKRLADTGKIQDVVATNMTELTAIVLNLIGAHIFPTGVTSFQTSMGPVFFVPATSPASAPSVPADAAPDSDGNATKVPATTVSGVQVQIGSSLFIPAIPVASGSATVPGTYQVTGTINLRFPARSL